MKRKSAVLFLLILFMGCQQHELEPDPVDGGGSSGPSPLTRSMGGFFDTDGTDNQLQDIITYLQLYNETHPFTTSFAEYYGNPLWSKAYNLPLDDYAVYIVPVLKTAEIGAIWIFEMDNYQTRYYILPRPVAGDSHYSLLWMFDYFNVELSLRNTNDAGEIIVFTESVTTRGWKFRHCNNIYTGYKENGEEILEYKETHCWTEYIEADTTFPTDMGGWGLIPDLGGGGGGSGGGSGTLPVPKKPLDFFKSTAKLSKDDKIKLENAINEMLADCYAEAIYNYLTENNVMFGEVSIDPTMIGTTRFGFDTNNITFGDSEFIDGGAIYHEMFHLLQKFQLQAESYSQLLGMMEYERTLFEDIAFKIKYANKRGVIKPKDLEKRKSPWVYSPMKTPQKEADKYNKWMRSLTKKFKTYPNSISYDDFSRWKPLFQTYTNSTYQGYDYTVTYNPVTINKAFELAKKNCGN